MRVLQVHNQYVEPGGEDSVVANEAELLRDHGHDVDLFLARNDPRDLATMPRTLKTGMEAVWNRKMAAALTAKLVDYQPDIVHIHNTFARLSPAVIYAAIKKKLPVVQTLHNYRRICANGLLLRQGAICEKCVGRRFPFAAVRYACFRESRVASLVPLLVQLVQQQLGIGTASPVIFLVLSRFARDLMIRGGLAADRLMIKPNFVPAVEPKAAEPPRRGFLFVGRIAEEKGGGLLLDAWEHSHLAADGEELILAGDGPAREALQRRYNGLPGVTWKGWLDRESVSREMQRARFLVMASRWYEGNPMVILEALARGTPVIGPDHGAFPEIIEAGRTGLLFTPGDAGALKQSLATASRLDPTQWQEWSRSARDVHKKQFSPESNYVALMRVYQRAQTLARE